MRNKKVWDLNIDEINFLYNYRHMNNYVFAALMTYHKSRYTLNAKIKINKKLVPECLHDPVQNFVDLSQYLGNDDPKIVRMHYTFRSYEIFQQLREVKIQEIENVIELLSVLAYIPIISEKNDEQPLWLYSVVRYVTEEAQQRFDDIIPNMDIDAYIKKHRISNDQKKGDDAFRLNKSLFEFTPLAVSSILTMIENGVDTSKTLRAFEIVEGKIIDYEKKNGLVGDEYPHKLKNYSQIRYRNTIHLYGGNLLERMGRKEEAFDWYTKDIYFVDIYDTFGFYLTALKTCERLICSIRVASLNQELILLKDCIKHCMKRAFFNAADHADRVLNHINTTRIIDLSANRFRLKNNSTLLYGGEASREVFLISLFYNRVVNSVDYANIPYNKYLIVT